MGALSLTTGTEGLGVTWQGGFDLWATATELARERHGFGPLSGDADDVFEQAEVLPRADVAAMGSPCQQASWAAWVASQGTERQCASPDGDHPMNQLYWRQIQPMKRRVKGHSICGPHQGDQAGYDQALENATWRFAHQEALGGGRGV